LPVIAEESAVHEAHGRRPGSALEGDLHRMDHAVRPGGPLVGEAMRRVPGGDGRLRDLAAEVLADRATESGLDLVGRTDPPAVELLADGQRLPDLLGRGLD